MSAPAGERPAGWPTELEHALPVHLGGQRWYAGEGAPDASTVSVEKVEQLWADEDGARRLWQVLVGVGDDSYQLVLGQRPAGEPAEFLHGHESSLLGAGAGSFFYDAVYDGDLARELLTVASGGRESASRSRSLSAEQSNTSLVFDDRLILKVFRRLRPGSNPDIEVTEALAAAGFQHVAEPLVHWKDDTYDLAFGQQFLSGGVDGWALALTSLRDLYNSAEPGGPGQAGGDFGAEAERLGRVTAEMHVALSEVFHIASGDDRPAQVWRSLVDGLPARLGEASEVAGSDLAAKAEPLLGKLATVTDPGPAIRVHGDFHLGQVMRTDAGWFVLDFEGEPAKPVEERTLPSSALKDVTGMLRSFHYASRHALVERALPDWGDLVPRARQWELHNRQAFLDGYQANPEIQSLLPDASVAPAVMAAYELDKALYELSYERTYRPEWVSIPIDALDRLVYGGGRSDRSGA